MEGLVSLLDKQHEARVRAIWQVLKEQFGITALPQLVPIPHISYYVAEHIDVNKMQAPLHVIAQQASPFAARATGLGLFTHPHLVLYIPVVRSVPLTALHGVLRPSFAAAAINPVRYYEADRWLPHITLAQGDLDHEKLAPALRWFQQKPIDWEITVDNVALIGGESGDMQQVHRFPFQPPIST